MAMLVSNKVMDGGKAESIISALECVFFIRGAAMLGCLVGCYSEHDGGW